MQATLFDVKTIPVSLTLSQEVIEILLAHDVDGNSLKKQTELPKIGNGAHRQAFQDTPGRVIKVMNCYDYNYNDTEVSQWEKLKELGLGEYVPNYQVHIVENRYGYQVPVIVVEEHVWKNQGELTEDEALRLKDAHRELNKAGMTDMHEDNLNVTVEGKVILRDASCEGYLKTAACNHYYFREWIECMLNCELPNKFRGTYVKECE